MKNLEQKEEIHNKEEKICSWCMNPVLIGEPLGESYDGEIMHFGCAAQADDPDDIF